MSNKQHASKRPDFQSLILNQFVQICDNYGFTTFVKHLPMTKHILVKELMDICARNKDGSFSTQAARRDILAMAGNQLLEMGFRQLPATGLKPKHVVALVERWKEEGLGPGTLKNRLSHLRWWAEKINKQNVVPRDNSALGIERRKYVTNESKAVDLKSGDIDKIKDERMKISIELQKAFGLRREECLKFQPQYATAKGTESIQLKSSWCKGGRAREIPILNDYQRDVLARAAAIAGNGSMIPPDQLYIQRLKQYEYATARAGMSRLHGLRHEYAQVRYKELTGRDSPAAGGLKARELNATQKIEDMEARLTISKELGHNREAITAVYLGR